MPRKPPAVRQSGRRYKLHTVTLDPETIERYDRIQAAVPELDGLSAAIRYAGRITEERLTTNTKEGKR